MGISLIHNPSLVFLDEPSPGVDAQTRQFISDYIRVLRDNDTAIVLTDHYLEEAERLSDFVVIIDRGELVTEGTVKEIKAKHGNGDNITISFGESVGISQLKQLVTDLKEVHLDGVISQDGVLRLNVDNGVKDLNNKIEPLVLKHKLEAKSISITECTLEDIFIRLTGREIRE